MRTAMHSLKSLLTILFIFALSPVSQAEGYRLYDLGMDAFERYYEVSCNDPYARGTIVVRFEESELEQDPSTSEYVPGETDPSQLPGPSATSGDETLPIVEICLQGYSCKANWTVAKAAQSFCK
ncbi:MAG TPA: hypothetical protein VIV20_05825 [Gammaproteobacteria bacterium]